MTKQKKLMQWFTEFSWKILYMNVQKYMVQPKKINSTVPAQADRTVNNLFLKTKMLLCCFIIHDTSLLLIINILCSGE